jgi:hypothetical protein
MLRPSACCRVWGAADLAPLQTLNNGTGWVTDFAYLEGAPYNKLVVAAQDRTMGGRVGLRAGWDGLVVARWQAAGHWQCVPVRLSCCCSNPDLCVS